MIAVQGRTRGRRRRRCSIPPSRRARSNSLLLRRRGGRSLVRRAHGYTGEDGFEVMLPTTEAAGFWARLREAGVAPCGLGAATRCDSRRA